MAKRDLEYVDAAEVFPEQGRVFRLNAGKESAGFGVVDTGVTRYKPVVELPDRRQVKKPTGRRQALVFDESEGQVRAIDANGIDFLGARRRALDPKEFHRRCRAQGDEAALKQITTGWRKAKRTARWPTGRGSIGRNLF